MTTYQEKTSRLVEVLRDGGEAPIGLRKNTSNLFRDRDATPKRRLDVKDFDSVIAVDADAGWVDVEGMTTYQKLVDATLPHSALPTVVPELKSITVGGAVAGVGVESSSFRYGLVHETVLEMDVLLGDGRIVTCTPDNEHRDLFFGFPNSYGSLGYAIRLRVETVTVKEFVALRHIRHENAESYFNDLAERCHEAIDFLDGTVFSPNELYITTGVFTDRAPYLSDYTFERMYYRSIRDRERDYLTTSDYIWRWDTDWFWCSKNLFMQNPVIRRLAGRSRLNSIAYTKVMRWNSRWGLTRRLNRLLGIKTEPIIQDVDIPIANAQEFLSFFQHEIGISPIWICPIRAHNPDHRFTLYPLDPARIYVNFGFWDVVKGRQAHSPGHFNRMIEQKVAELDGIKSLYSDAYYSRDEFDQIYNAPAYRRLKAKYDPRDHFQDMYDKCVRQA